MIGKSKDIFLKLFIQELGIKKAILGSEYNSYEEDSSNAVFENLESRNEIIIKSDDQLVVRFVNVFGYFRIAVIFPKIDKIFHNFKPFYSSYFFPLLDFDRYYSQKMIRELEKVGRKSFSSDFEPEDVSISSELLIRYKKFYKQEVEPAVIAASNGIESFYNYFESSFNKDLFSSYYYTSIEYRLIMKAIVHSEDYLFFRELYLNYVSCCPKDYYDYSDREVASLVNIANIEYGNSEKKYRTKLKTGDYFKTRQEILNDYKKIQNIEIDLVQRKLELSKQVSPATDQSRFDVEGHTLHIAEYMDKLKLIKDMEIEISTKPQITVEELDLKFLKPIHSAITGSFYQMEILVKAYNLTNVGGVL